MAERTISLRGVEVHNLKSIDLDLPQRQLIVFCGVSGSGKSSLAFDTLYAEGQRRYIESFSAYTRQFLERLEKPAAQRIDGISPAIAVAASTSARSSRSTVGTSTEAYDYLRLLLARIGRVLCRQCGREVLRHTSQSVAARAGRAAGRYAVHGRLCTGRGGRRPRARPGCPARGRRIRSRSRRESHARVGRRFFAAGGGCFVLIDRLTAGSTAEERLRDSLETALRKGHGQAVLYVEEAAAAAADLGGARP